MPTMTGALRSDSIANRYRIERELGRGGMATVYLAQDVRHDRPVALKVLHRELAASLGAERFLREIGIAARLSHPHILPLLDSGESGGVLFYVAPYVPGGSLRDRLDSERQLPIAEVVRIAKEVGSGLDFVHRSGFVHRDLKPANILFVDGHAVLADFGVAHAVFGGELGSLTEGGIAVGTPAYMSPEQASADKHLASHSDIYSFACVTYEMLAGEPPFTGRSSREVMAKHVLEVPRPVRTLRPDAPAQMEQALAIALAKNPVERQPTVAHFTGQLEAVAHPPRTSGARTRAIAVLPFVNASGDPENEFLSDGITDELIDALAKVDGLRVASRTSVFALKGKAHDVRAIGVLLGTAFVLEGTLRRSGDRLRITAQLTCTDDGRLVWSQRYDRTLDDVLAMQDEIARTIVGALRATSFSDLAPPTQRRYTDNVKAYGLYLRGRYAWNQRTQEGVAEGIKFFQQAIAEDPNFAAAYTGLADSYALHVDYRSIPVDEGFERARKYARQAIALDDSLAEAHASLAWTLFIHDWQFAEADKEFRRAIELDPRYATAHHWYGFLLASQGRMDEALVEAHTALEIDPASIPARRSAGWLYFYARRYDQAQYHIERALELNPTAEETHRVLGLALAFGGHLEEGERVLRDGMQMPGAGSYSRATLGYVLAKSGKRDEACDILEALSFAAKDHYVSPVAFATLHLGLGNYEEALTWAERSVAERRGWVVYFNHTPMVDPLRGNPRFEALVRSVGLPQRPALPG